MKVAICDFETQAIAGNVQQAPPEPVGLAYQLPGGVPQYVTDAGQMLKALDKLSYFPCVFHNAPFDLAVWRAYVPTIPLPTIVHDTMHLLFLNDPYSKSLALKPAAAALLGEPPNEQDLLKDWICTHIKGATAKNHGAYIADAPVELVRPYAIGDVTRTAKLFKLLEKHTEQPTYQTEMALMPILMEGSREGVLVGMFKLERDIHAYTIVLDKVTKQLWKLFGNEFNLDSPAQLVAELEAKDWMSGWEYTENGNKSVAATSLQAHCTNRKVLGLLGYHSALTTLLGTFMQAWYVQAQATEGRLHCNWNAVRSYESGNQTGTRTGRMSSSSPNLTNVPTVQKVEVPKGLPALPVCRRYLKPEKGHVWLSRDFDSQEVRILAHFEDGILLEAYKKDPALDPHEMARQLIKETTGMDIERKLVKITAFAVIYGAGAQTLSKQLGCTTQEATQIKQAYLKTFPGVRELQQMTTMRGRTGEGITTLRGRHYKAEPPKLVGGKYMTFEYKLLNYLIQGSAADQTKKCIVDWYSTKGKDTRFLATVHDEINISVPLGQLKKEGKKLQEAMDQPLLDCPMRSTGKTGLTWGDIG